MGVGKQNHYNMVRIRHTLVSSGVRPWLEIQGLSLGSGHIHDMGKLVCSVIMCTLVIVTRRFAMRAC